MHNGRDVTARKSLEWGDVDRDEMGNRSLRYMFDATIWDREIMTFNTIFKFDAKGNIIGSENVAGFPRKKEPRHVDVTTQKGMQELVEDFFSKNYIDITSRETIDWGQPEKTAGGNVSIRYKYRALIWDKDTLIENRSFTFNTKVKFVYFKNVEGYPKKQ